MFPDRFKTLLPPPSTESLRQNTKGKRDNHPRPIHLVQENMTNAREVETAIHPIQDGTSKQKGKYYLDDLIEQFLCIHILSKDK